MNNPEKMLYQFNKSGSNLVIYYILLNMFYTIVVLNFMPLDINVGSFTLINIVISLGAFLGSTKLKVYNLKWSYVGIVFAVIQSLRFLTIPETFESNLRFMLIFVLELSALLLFVGSMITINKTKQKEKFEKTQESQVN